MHAAAHQLAFELWHLPHELLVLVVGAKTHDPFDPGTVVPGPVDQHSAATCAAWAASRAWRDTTFLTCAIARTPTVSPDEALRGDGVGLGLDVRAVLPCALLSLFFPVVMEIHHADSETLCG